MTPSSEQPASPYLDAVVAYGFRGSARWHVPGHKGGTGADPGLRYAIGDRALAFDVPQDVHGIDVGPSPTPYERAERLAAEAYGAGRTWFLTNGATQGNHALCLALAPLGTPVVAQRNSHASIVDGLVLSGGLPTFVSPEFDDELGMAHGVTPQALAQALGEAPDARAAFLVSPTYYGMATDVAACAEVAHAHGVALVIDCSWGPHFGFHDVLPPNPLTQGADAVLTSTHKFAGSLTQSAMLHVARDGRIDVGAVARAVRLVRSTSPSALLLASLDSAGSQLALHGEQLLQATLAGIAAARRSSRPCPASRSSTPTWSASRASPPTTRCGSCSTCGPRGARAKRSPTRCAAPTMPTPSWPPGHDRLRRRHRPVEFALERMAGDVEEVVKRLSRGGTTSPIIRPPAMLRNEMATSPRDAFLGEAEEVTVDDAVGRVSCESIAGYPPGIRRSCPASGSRRRRCAT